MVHNPQYIHNGTKITARFSFNMVMNTGWLSMEVVRLFRSSYEVVYSLREMVYNLKISESNFINTKKYRSIASTFQSSLKEQCIFSNIFLKFGLPQDFC